MVNRTEVFRMSSSSSSSPHIPQLDSQLWASRIAGHAELADERLNTRLGVVLATLAAKPLDSIPQANSSCSQAQGMYRFFANQRIDFDDLMQPVADGTLDLCHDVKTLLAVQDSSSLNFTSLKTTTGLGPIGNAAKARGLRMHTTLAVRDDGVTLGLLGQSFWGRPAEKRTGKKIRKLPIEEKESHKWLDGIEAAEAGWQALPAEQRPRLVHVMDREGDIHEVLQRISDSPHYGVIRCAHNRSVAGDLDYAFATVEAAPLLGVVSIDVPRAAYQPVPNTPQRQARLSISAVTLTITPSRKKRPNRQPVTWTLLDVRETDPPVGVEALHWRLWTNLPADTLDDILEILRFYGFRWRVEDFHLILKSGCQIEKLELETADRLSKAALLYAAVAVRILALRDLARVQPDAPCTLIVAEEEWQVLWVRFAKTKLTAHTQPPTIQQVVRWIGRLGGHLGRKRDGLPGVRTLWRGFRDLTVLACGFRAGKNLR
jgi:Transposase DNA-binding/Transposase Tn5 dimerisation domain